MLEAERLIEYIRYGKGVGLRSINVNSNGQLLTEDLAGPLLESGVDLIVFGLDAFSAPVYEKLRGGKFDTPLAISDVLQFSVSAGESATTSGTGPLLHTLWCEALGVDHVSPNWNFFDAGGTSLAALQLAQRIESATGISVGVIDLFRYPTLGEMEAHLRRGGRTVHDSAVMVAAQRRAELRRASMLRFSSSFQLHP